MANNPLHGSCFCGEVKFEVSGDPVAMGFCHCGSCRHWSAGPVNAFSLWNPRALAVTHGAASIGMAAAKGSLMPVPSPLGRRTHFCWK